MASSPSIPWQASLFAAGPTIDIDRSFTALSRIRLDEKSWVDYAPGWISGADRLFEHLLTSRSWQQRERPMYDGRVPEPRLTSAWTARSDDPLLPPVLEDIRRIMSSRYERDMDSVGLNLYRDGRDSVAWHADHIAKEIRDPVVALVSLGEPRRFLLRPNGRGGSRAFLLGRGDLLVTGGGTQRTWQHSVPKVGRAGPRISLAYRHSS